MGKTESVSIIIPAYNEEQGLTVVLSKIKELSLGRNWEIIVVDDCSIDNTSSVTQKFAVKAIRHPYHKGYGAALKTGIRAAQNEILVFLDGDDQHSPDDISLLLAEIGQYDMVVGRRGAQAGEWIRKPGKWFLSRVANYLSGVKIPDINCGFRAVKKKCAEEFIGLYPNGFSLSTTLTLAMITGGYNVTYVPIQVFPRKGGKSMVKQGPDGLKTLLLILRCIMLFNPFKVFFPVSAFLFMGGAAFTAYSLIQFHKVSNSSIIVILSSLIIFFFGLIADQITAIRRFLK